MKMPSSIINKVEVKPSTESLGDAAKQCLMCLEKKVRNLEKRKSKIEFNREKLAKGTKLEKEQELSLTQYDQVTHDLEFARELHKQFISINQEHDKMVKKQTKREKMERTTAEIKRVGEILHLQSTLDLLGGSEVREDFKTGRHGAVVLTEDNLDQLDKLYQAISPSRDDSGTAYPERLTTAADHLVNILEGKDRAVLGTTYKELKELLTLINDCGYFENANRVAKPEVDSAEPSEEVSEEAPEEVKVTPAPEVGSGESVEVPVVVEALQPIDLTIGAGDGGVISQMPDIVPAPQPNTREQDAFFAPSSTQAYQEPPSGQYGAPVYGQAQHNAQQAPDFESFTQNRPFQFIQTSYVMPEDAANAPSVVDPAVIHAQPAASSITFMSQSGFDGTSQSQTSSTGGPPQPQPTQPPTHQPTQPSQPSDYNTQGYPQQQDQSQLTQEQQDEKKFQMNVAAPVFNPTMYAQQVASGQAPSPQGPQGPPPSQESQASPDYNNAGATQGAGGDFTQGYQGNGFNNGYRGRGSFRGSSRGGGPANGSTRGHNAGSHNTGSQAPAQMQNGFGNRGGNPSPNNTRGGGRGGSTFQGYPPNTNYRPDSFQGNNNNYTNGGFNKFQGRGGISGAQGGNTTYQRGGPGGGRGAGGLRGMPRGGTTAGPRGGATRGGYSRPPPQ